MKISEIKQALAEVEAVNFRLPTGEYLPAHFHVTEVGLVSKHFIDCGGVERQEQVANFQLWEAGDYDHRLAPQKFLHILNLSEKILGTEDLGIEVEYQQATIGKFGLTFDGTDFVLTAKQTACLAQDACGIPAAQQIVLPQVQTAGGCTPGGGCC
ncbi:MULTISPECIES: DUF6428 family protein [Hymenobacter]|uniref:Uncharacterized protein n=2 Tax=Hymenobacter TaxID=89966 RepID=A0A3R9NCH4_9BACT|nr:MULTISPECIES: DUF6428 family protein [Hymenobacter]QNE42088.1 hypothetical protein F1C16_20915 [Hymenobacter sp. NBH84]RSK25009.1 hypothetical protein EI290_18470 [Hymenobacter metallilatus]SHL31762.1 hypothetical protein SAMN02746009_02522 [Hymenobacter psychrotolerans DSM 18569]